MKNNAFTKCTLATALVLLVSGCMEEKIDATGCWSADTKTSFLALARNGVLQALTTQSMGVNLRGLSAAEFKAILDKGLTVTADAYHVANADPKVGSLTCGANLSMQFERPDGKHFSANNAPTTFQVFKGETGHVYSIENGLSFARLINDLTSD
ncbi:MAG: hypothetical protein V4448_09175 [Pseudomonadota bacterium]